jgi:hypothetical protein
MDFAIEYNFKISTFVGCVIWFVRKCTGINTIKMSEVTLWAPGYSTGLLAPTAYVGILDFKRSPCSECRVLSWQLDRASLYYCYKTTNKRVKEVAIILFMHFWIYHNMFRQVIAIIGG